MYMCPRCGFYTLVEVENEEHLKCEVCDLRIYADGKSTDIVTGVDFTERYYRAIKVGDTLVYKDMPYVMRGVPVHYLPVLDKKGMSENILEMSARLFMQNVEKGKKLTVQGEDIYVYQEYMRMRITADKQCDAMELLSQIYEDKLKLKVGDCVDVLIRDESNALSHTTARAYRTSYDGKYVNVIDYRGIHTTLRKETLMRIVPGVTNLKPFNGSCMKGDHDID